MDDIFELRRFRVRQLLPPEGFLTLWYDEAADGGIRLRTSKPLYVGLADVTVEWRRKLGDSQPSEYLRTDKAGQQLVSVSFDIEGLGMEVDDTNANCLGLMREGDDMFKLAEYAMNRELFSRVIRD